MDCAEFQPLWEDYLYGELTGERQRTLSEHLQECAACSRDIADLAAVMTAVAKSRPERWLPGTRRAGRSASWIRILAWAATVLLAFLSGNVLDFSPVEQAPPVAASAPDAAEILGLLAQNQLYRESMSWAQILQAQQMEQRLAQVGGVVEQVQKLHEIERFVVQGQIAQAIRAQENFVEMYQDSPLTPLTRVCLARNLLSEGEYRKAAGFFEVVLLDPALQPMKRGEYLWNLSLCCDRSGQSEQFDRILRELEKESGYGEFCQKAIKVMADRDFERLRFPEALARYRECAQGGEASVEVERRISWIEFHSRDNYYPIVLYINARNNGPAAHYGLGVILEQYPDSPLVLPAFYLYLEYAKDIWPGLLDASLPAESSAEAMLPYLSQLARLQELNELATFALYRKACLLEKAGDSRQAVQCYRTLAQSGCYTRLSEISGESLRRLTGTQ